MDSRQRPRQARCLFARDRPKGSRACELAPVRRWPQQFWRPQFRRDLQHPYFDDRRSVAVRQSLLLRGVGEKELRAGGQFWREAKARCNLRKTWMTIVSLVGAVLAV